MAAIDDAEAARAEEAAAERARQAEAAQAAHYVASHRAELLRAASEAVGRAEAVLRQLRASQEAGRGALRRVEERARRLQVGGAQRSSCVPGAEQTVGCASWHHSVTSDTLLVGVASAQCSLCETGPSPSHGHSRLPVCWAGPCRARWWRRVSRMRLPRSCNS